MLHLWFNVLSTACVKSISYRLSPKHRFWSVKVNEAIRALKCIWEVAVSSIEPICTLALSNDLSGISCSGEARVQRLVNQHKKLANRLKFFFFFQQKKIRLSSSSSTSSLQFATCLRQLDL